MKFCIQKVDYKDKTIAKKIFERLYFLKRDYPRFYEWYTWKVIPGLEDDLRQIYFATPVNDGDTIAAVMILKNDAEEKKISTLCVMEDYRSLGLGTELVSIAVRVLGTDTPLITVSSSHKSSFDPLFRKFGFHQFKEYPNYYRNQVSEYAYNGYLDSPVSRGCSKKVG